MSKKYQQRQQRPLVKQYHSSSEDSDSDSDSGAPQPQQLINREIENIKQELKSVPYELILQQMNPPTITNKKKPANTPKIGRKIKKPITAKPQKTFKNQAVQQSIHTKPFKKAPVIFEPERKKAIDPRFESYAGHYNQDLAMKTYNFIPKLQKAEISQLKSKLKNPTKKNRLNPHEREVLSKQYNQLTNDVKRTELMQLEKQTKNELKKQHGDNYYLGKKTVRHEFQRKKLEGMSEQEREQKMREQYTKLNRRQLDDRRKTLHFKSR